MHINVIIPTVHRPKLLRETINSLALSTHADLTVFVVVDGNEELLEMVARWKVVVIYNRERRDWIFSMNRALQFAHGDAVIYASDDLVFEPECVEIAARRLHEREPELDGLLAITQSVKGCSTAFGMMGRMFIERFPNRQVFCPDYVHYASDFELGRYARSINKLYLCPEAKVLHHRLRDLTWNLAKPIEVRDITIQRKRAEQHLLWGRDFTRLTTEGQDAC